MLPPASSSGAVAASASHHNHYRNFICTDCNLGFRSHGVLTKHLRSKNHVKTLVSIGKLPEEANHLLVKEHAKALGSIDAGDCEKALHSTKRTLFFARRYRLILKNYCPSKCRTPKSPLYRFSGTPTKIFLGHP